MAEILVRPADAGDIPELMDLFGELERMQRDWRVFPLRSTFRQETEASYRSSLADPNAVLLVAFDGDRVVGGARGHVQKPSSFSDELAVEVSSVIVRSSHRGRGIARSLVGEVARFATERGLRRVTLKTFAQNAQAQAYWERLGFRTRIIQMTAEARALTGESQGADRERGA